MLSEDSRARSHEARNEPSGIDNKSCGCYSSLVSLNLLESQARLGATSSLFYCLLWTSARWLRIAGGRSSFSDGGNWWARLIFRLRTELKWCRAEGFGPEIAPSGRRRSVTPKSPLDLGFYGNFVGPSTNFHSLFHMLLLAICHFYTLKNEVLKSILFPEKFSWYLGTILCSLVFWPWSCQNK